MGLDVLWFELAKLVVYMLLAGAAVRWCWHRFVPPELTEKWPPGWHLAVGALVVAVVVWTNKPLRLAIDPASVQATQDRITFDRHQSPAPARPTGGPAHLETERSAAQHAERVQDQRDRSRAHRRALFNTPETHR